ncbi:gamma-interferon-inducible lysosomal thiol reductase-like protein [Brevipalpus obovatus]|uniref:gamma-interferon-inducible lysosomal thiol reductase-like protein n=1 Tax=Brevipalpus obovatus TaxID=246614 RepID=UPI003D9F7AB5
MVPYKIMLLVFLSLGCANFRPVEPCSFNIEVYYATWCGYCKRLIGEQFGGSQNLLEKVANVTLIPFGFLPGLKDGKFVCGPDDCMKGKVHACILKILAQNDALQAIICLEQQNEVENGLKLCAEKLEFSHQDVSICAEEFGSEYLTQYAKIAASLQPPIKGWPTLVFNGTRDDQFEMEMLGDTKKALCSRCADPMPQECEE